MNMQSISPEWRVRQYDAPAFVRDVTNPHPRACIVDIGDDVILYLQVDPSEEDVCVRVMQIAPGGRMAGEISRSNRLGVGGDERLAAGVSVEFEHKHVFRLEKATQQGGAPVR
jgi:hypothetical protein